MTDNTPQEPESPVPMPPGRRRFALWVFAAVLALLVVGVAWLSLSAQDRNRILKKVERTLARDIKKAEQDTSRLENETKADATKGKDELDAEWTNWGKEALHDGRKAMDDLDTEWTKLEKDAFRDEGKTMDNLRNDVADEGEALLSDARLVLKELADNTPVPTPVETVGEFHSALPDVQTPLQVDTFPERPALFGEPKDNPYFGRGAITRGFQSFTGAQWQPQYFIYGNFRSGLQTLNSGTGPRTPEWVNRLDVYGNLNLTPTERFLVGVRPLDSQNSFSGYLLGPRPGPLNAINHRITTLFFEGNSLSLFPSLDNMRDNWYDVDFTVGRQDVSYQDGILLNDYVDMVGATRASTFFLGSSASKMSMVYVWGNIHRADGAKTDGAGALGWTVKSDYPTTTVEGNLFYGYAPTYQGGDGVYGAISGTQRFGKFDTTFRLLGSHAIEGTPGNAETVGNGALLFSQISTKPDGTDNILYLDTYVGPGRFTSVSRSFDVGGPLGSTGLLFASTQLGHFPAAINPYPNDSIGGALGYQMFLDDLDKHQLTLELGGSASSRDNDYKAGMMTVQYQRAFDQHFIWTIGGVSGVQSTGTPLWGLRTEISVSF